MASETFDAMVRLLADNRGFVTSFKEVTDTTDETTAAITRDSDEASLSMDKMGERAGMLRDAFSSLAGMVGIAGVGFGLKDMVESGEKLQLEQVQLQNALKATGEDARGTADSMEAMAERMSTTGGFSNQENLAALTQFTNQTKSATKAQTMLALATNIARETGDNLEDTVSAVSKAYNGQARGLQTLLGPIVNATNAQVGLTVSHQKEIAAIAEQASLLSGPAKTAFTENADIQDHITAAQQEQAELQDKLLTGRQLLTAATARFADSTAAYSRTVAGEQSNLKNSFDNLGESIGEDLLPAVKDLLGPFAAVAGWMQKNRREAEILVGIVLALGGAWAAMKAVKGTISVFKDLGGGIDLVRKGLVKLGMGFLATGAEGEAAGDEAAAGAMTAAGAWEALMTATIIGIVIVGLIELVEHWHAVEGAALDAWHWIESHWKLLLPILLGPFAPLLAIVVEIVTHLHEMARLAEDVGHVFSHAFGGIGSDIGHVFGSLFNQGGVVHPVYRDLGGMIPMGTDTVPAMLTPGEGVLSVQGMDALSALNSGQFGRGMGGQVSIRAAGQIVLRTTDRDIGEAALRWFTDRAARGPSSLVGGALSIQTS